MICLKTILLHFFKTHPTDFPIKKFHPAVFPQEFIPILADLPRILRDSRYPHLRADLQS